MNKRIMKAKSFITWPWIINGLTISRILLGLPIIISLKNDNNEVFIFLILIAGLTDYLDGYFARKNTCKLQKRAFRTHPEGSPVRLGVVLS